MLIHYTFPFLAVSRAEAYRLIHLMKVQFGVPTACLIHISTSLTLGTHFYVGTKYAPYFGH
jgi:hypothetical protein